LTESLQHKPEPLLVFHHPLGVFPLSLFHC
jgi:hypothetical protein